MPTFTKETDNFALAVHIFALLMNGCHPYACARDMGADIDSLSTCKSSVALPQPIENICTGNFTFYNPAKGTKPPVYAPDYGMLPENIRQLFARAFVTGSDDPAARPDAVEWFKALDGLLHSLKKCKTDATHIFPANAGSCPWCQLNSGKQPPPPPPPPPELSDGGNGNNGSTGTQGTQKDPPLTYDELKVLGDSIEANAGGKKIIKTVSRVGNCVILELKKKKNNLTAFVDKSISSITEDGNKIRYFFYDEGNAEGIELYINNNINKPGNSGSGGGKRNKVKNQTGNKSKKWIIIPIVIAAAVAATLIILFATEVLPPNENTINKENTTNTESTINNKIIGEWESQDFDGTFVYTFKDDGSGNYDAQGLQMPFTFTTNGDKISILYNGDTNSFDTVYKIDDDVLMLKDSLDQDVLYNRKGKKTKIEKNTDSDVTLLSLAENITEQFGEISYVYNIDAKIHYTIEGDDIVHFEITEGEVIPYMLNFITESHEKKHIGGKANGQETILYDYEEYYINDNFGENVLYTKFYSDTSDNGWTKAEGVMKTDYFFLQSIFYNIYEKNTEATLTEITEKVNGKETYKIELSFPGEELKEELEKIFMLNEYLDNDFTKVEVKTEIFIYKENNLPARIYMDFGENGKKIIENELRNIASDYADDVVVKCDKFYIDMVIDDYGKAEKIEVPSEVLNAAKINSDI